MPCRGQIDSFTDLSSRLPLGGRIKHGLVSYFDLSISKKIKVAMGKGGMGLGERRA